ncbi:MAG TPA: hypothetical protein VGA99_12970 [bacterium]|jgi:hypothetical protein
MSDFKKSHCRHLRTKMAYIPDVENSENWRTGESSTHQYWCLCTMTTCGPDSELVAPERCQRDRTCYREVDLV